MNSNDTKTSNDTIIDLNPDQVVHENEPIKPAAVESSKIRSKSTLMMGVALLAAAVAGGWAYKDYLSRYYPNDQVLALSDKMAILEASNAAQREQLAAVDRLASQLKTDVDALETNSAATATQVEEGKQAQSAAASRISEVEQRLIDTKKSLDVLASRPGVAGEVSAIGAGTDVSALTQRIETLEKDVASLKANPTAPDSDVSLLSQSLSDLKAKLAAGAAYGAEFERIQRMVPAAPGLDVLSQHAPNGIANASGLAKELTAIIPDLPKPIIPGPVAESEGWWAGIFNSLSDLITIKVEGDVDWPTAASAAAALAESGDLPQAIEQLNAVEGAKPPVLQQWVDRASARLSAEKALKDVDEAVLRVIAAKG